METGDFGTVALRDGVTSPPMVAELAGLHEELPGRMTALESQFVQFRLEMRGQFSAFKNEIREEIRQEFRAFGEMMDERFSLVDRRFAELATELGTQMRVLHEELLDRIARIGKG